MDDTLNHDSAPRKSNELSAPSFYSKINDPMQAIQLMGEMISGSGMFGCTKVEQGMVLAMQCLAEGKAPLELAKTYHIIEGKLTMRADAMLGRYLASGGKVKWTERTDKRVAGMWTCDGNDVEIAVSLDEMIKNGVAGSLGKIKANWQKFPRQMLTARCISEAVRLLMPQIVAGIYTPEEVSDFSNSEKNIVTKPVPVAAQISEVEIVEDPVNAVKGRLDELLQKYEPRATKYLSENGYIKIGQTYRDLDAMTAQRILTAPSKIVAILESIK